MTNFVEQNGFAIVRTPKGVGAQFPSIPHKVNEPVKVECTYRGRLLKALTLGPFEPNWRDFFGEKIDHLRIGIRVSIGTTVMAELPQPFEDPHPFMVIWDEQMHVTENYVSVPPALTITDELGAVWTLGLETAPKEKSPDGEFAFGILRDGVDLGEICSRVERRYGKIRVFTRHGWKNWTGSTFV